MLANFVQETTATTGTGAITLAGAVSGFAAFSAQYEDGDVLYYTIESGTSREFGVGTFTLSGTTLARTTVLETLVAGTIDSTSPAAISLTGTSTISVSGLAQTQFSKPRVVDATNKYFIANNFIEINDTSAKGGGAFSASGGRITARAYFFAHRTKITTLGAEVNTTSAGGLFNLALYSSKAGSIAGGNLLDSTGDLSTASAGLVSATLGSPLDLAAGWYWLLAKVDNTTAAFAGARPASGRFILQPDSGIATGRGAHLINYWDTTYATGFLSTVDGYGVPDGSTGWETPEAIMS